MPRLELDEGGPDLRVVAERRDGKWDVRKDAIPEKTPRPPEHNHENDPNTPVLVFDLHGTMTPDQGFPLTQAPFPGLKGFIDLFASRGCCVHIATGSLATSDPLIYAARELMIRSWLDQHGLLVGFIGPKISASTYLDDRAVPLGADVPDWDALAVTAAERLAESFVLDDAGRYQKREDLKPQGKPIENWPDLTEVPDDQPRGFTTPILDIDLHRVLNPGWGSTREDAPNPAAVKLVNQLYDEGYVIHVSCAGWNPATHSPQQVMNRLAAQRLYTRRYGIKADRLVTKDDSTLYFDNLALRWPAEIDTVRTRLNAPHPERTPVAYSGEKALEMKAPEPSKPLEVHVHLPEGMVKLDTHTHIEDGAVRVENTHHSHIEEGAVQITQTPVAQPKRTRVQHADGTTSVIERE